MPGFEKDHEFLYSRGVSSDIVTKAVSITLHSNDFPRYSLVWGASPPPTPSMICIHGLTPPQRGNLGRNFGTIRALPAILLRWYYFWNFSLGCLAVPIWERSMENLEIKKMGRLFPKTFFGLFTLVIWLYNVYFGCLFTKCGFYRGIWKFL